MAKKLKTARYAITLDLASFDDLPAKDEIVDILCSGMFESNGNMTADVEIKPRPNEISEKKGETDK